MSERNQPVCNGEADAGAGYVTATVVLFLLLSGVLAYAYPHFLPGPPEQAVRRFLVAHQAGTWDYVDYVLIGPLSQREDYVRAAGRCRLVGFEIADSYTKRMRWATGKFAETETLRVREYYAADDRLAKVQVDYVLRRRGGEWFIELDSILGDGGIQQFFHRRGVAVRTDRQRMSPSY